MTERAPGTLRWGPVLAVGIVGTIVIVVCAALGWWQWTAGTQAQGPEVETSAQPIAEVIEPAQPAEGAVGATVRAPGQWADADAALVAGRTIEGSEAVLVVRPFTVAADASGTGAEGTLGVVVGWADPDTLSDVPSAPAESEVVGYFRGSEGLSGIGDMPTTDVPGAFWVPTLSPAIFAQHWDSPLYSAVLIAETPEEGLNALPAPEPPAQLNFRSITYALEWWLFGAFFAFIAGRWIRDNGRVRPAVAKEHAEADTATSALKEGPS